MWKMLAGRQSKGEKGIAMKASRVTFAELKLFNILTVVVHK